jgi:hypothetical protein
MKSHAHPEEQTAMTTAESAGPALVLGPMLRYVSETEATIWVETDRECRVEVLGRSVPTFAVAGHHYALVVVDGLAPGSEHEYQVALDGTVRWPLPGSGFPPSVLRTLRHGRPVRLAFGSCRVAEVAPQNLDRRTRRQRATQRAPREPDDVRGASGDPIGEEGTDTLAALAANLRDAPRDSRPDLLLMIGDQVYADEPGPATRRFMSEHRAAEARAAENSAPAVTAATAPSALAAAPAGEVADFAEYCALYWEAWSEPAVRWLFSVVPTAMIFDDHEVHDDWNTSAVWRREAAAKPWWPMRIQGAYQSYWVYQHLGNLSPDELAADETWGKICQQGNAAELLADLARRADQRAPGIRWSFLRTFSTTGSTTGGKVRVVVLDSRSRRVVDGKRLIADEAEWQWFTEAVSGDWEHVVIATSVPPLLPRGIHTLEAWDEKIRGGAWGRWAVGFGERLRQAVDLEHWPAFGESFAKLEELLTALATGRRSMRGEPPVSVTVISGDVHHSYLAAVDLRRADGAAVAAGPVRVSAVYEAVCSPFHQAMPPKLRVAQRLASTKLSGMIGTVGATLSGARIPGIGWRITEGPWFDNMIATLTYQGPRAVIRFDRAENDSAGSPRLAPVLETDLTK